MPKPTGGVVGQALVLITTPFRSLTSAPRPKPQPSPFGRELPGQQTVAPDQHLLENDHTTNQKQTCR